MSESTYRSFEQLDVWKEARSLRQLVYELTKRLPKEEQFVLVPQLRRAVLSVTNNIAEGHGRFHYQENIQFLRHARGSLEEVMDDLTLCEDQQYLRLQDLTALRTLAIKVEKLINGYIRYLAQQRSASMTHESPARYEVPIADHESRVTDHESPITRHESPITDHGSLQ